MSQDWRVEVNAEDYFGHQRKAVEISNRRPVLWRASDLVGPGIGAVATAITDFDDTLATFNGFFSAVAGTFGAPTATEAFVGVTVSDAVLGGTQTFTGMTTGSTYRRMFQRNPSDADSIFWRPWVDDGRVPTTMYATSSGGLTLLPINIATFLAMPTTLRTTGTPGTFSSSGTSLNILRPGIYSGSIVVGGFGDFTQFSTYNLRVPNGAGTEDRAAIFTPSAFAGGVRNDFLFSTTVGTQAVRFSATQTQNSAGGAAGFLPRLQITRLGDVS